MINRLLIIALLLSLVGCKSTYKAKTKSELAKLCLAEFPINNEPIDTKTDTITITKTEWLEVDCDSIGKRQVPHECEVKTVVKTITVPDSRQTYIIQNLEGQIELLNLNAKNTERTNKEVINSLKKTHKEEKENLKERHDINMTLIKKQRNNYLWILIALGAILGINILRRLKIIRI